MTVLDQLQLNDNQTEAATAPGDMVVTAGAGSGKTRTLVGRYLALLEAGLPLRSIVAITFTEKAAREMRARIRASVATWLEKCGDPAEQARWEKAFSELDGARIGTIHALCAEILRAHPAEAQVDPEFEVLDENHAALLSARATEAALAWAAAAPDVIPLFEYVTEYQLRQMLVALMGQRLDASAAFEASSLPRWSDALADWFRGRLEKPGWVHPLDELARLQSDQPDDKLEIARREVLAHWDEARSALDAREWDVLFAALLALRQAISTHGRKGNWDGDDLAAARGAMKSLRTYFEAQLAPLVDKKKPPSWNLDERCVDALHHLQRLFKRALAEYEHLKADRRALDFDDLEAGALALLAGKDEVRARWQSQTCAVLVDEFQDTNSRQQQIVYALAGFPTSQTGDLFIVGDSKQSIYRFRGADVTVFRQVQTDVKEAGGRHVSLDLTFRAHEPLVTQVNELLAPILGEQDDPERPYAVPFAPLTAHRQEPRPGISPPHVELHLGLGESADEGRAAAAAGLAGRLKKLRREENVQWGECALLFRASTGFPPYEDELERAGIPFVTVAGRGFYDRPEVRDLLNALKALADPTDDLALAGLLRSPAFALTDAALYLLRRREEGGKETSRSLWGALNGSLDFLRRSDAARACRAREIVTELHELSGRVSVGNLLARLLDATHYRAALRLAGGQRLCRNVDKLLADAHRSGLVSVGEFLEYVQSLRDVAAREGEAPVEAEGAVQLMTVHKAKGLEFPVVVIADAAYAGRHSAPPVLIAPDLGVLLDLREEEARPALHRLASLREADQEEAESRRLLYVAATRAKEKLIVSGHVKAKKDGRPQLRGWLEWLGQVVGLDELQLPDSLSAPQHLELNWKVSCALYPRRGEEGTKEQEDKETGRRGGKRIVIPDLVDPLAFAASVDADAKLRERESKPPPRVWRVVPTAQHPRGPALVIGALVHAALRHWRFPDQPGLEEFLRPFALEAGLTDRVEIRQAIAGAQRLLARFQAHPLHAKLDLAERRHEMPYSVEVDGAPRSGIVDLLCRSEGSWTLVEFKSDRLSRRAEVEPRIRNEKYDQQVEDYVAALSRVLGERPRALLVFLNVGQEVAVAELDTRSECGKIQLLNFTS